MHQLLYLSQADVEAVGLTMADVIEALEAMFHEKGAGWVEMSPKPGIHTRPDAFIHAMPAYIPALESAGIKWVSGYPESQKRGLPYITGLLVLNDPDTDVPLAVMDCVWITAKRTGAASAVAARYLARPDSEVVGILGCGVQGRSNLEALNVPFFQDIPPIHAELSELVTGQKPGRETSAERTMACNLGLALDDMATAPLIYQRAKEQGIGTWLPL